MPDIHETLPENDFMLADSGADLSDLDQSDLHIQNPPMHPPLSGPLTGYEYTQFEPNNPLRELPGDLRASPTQHQASSALEDLQIAIRPKRQTGRGYQDPNLNLWTQARLEGMQSLLLLYTNTKSLTYDNWGASSCQAAIGMGRGQHCARRL